MAKSPKKQPLDSYEASDLTAIPATPFGMEKPSRRTGISAFLSSVAGDCPCERCTSYRDMARMINNPGSEY